MSASRERGGRPRSPRPAQGHTQSAGAAASGALLPPLPAYPLIRAPNPCGAFVDGQARGPIVRRRNDRRGTLSQSERERGRRESASSQWARAVGGSARGGPAPCGPCQAGGARGSVGAAMLGLAGRCSAAAASAARPALRRAAGPSHGFLPLLLSRGAGPAAAVGARECGAAAGSPWGLRARGASRRAPFSGPVKAEGPSAPALTRSLLQAGTTRLRRPPPPRPAPPPGASWP